MRIPHVNPMGGRGPDNPGPFNPDTRGMSQGAQGLANLGGAVANIAQDMNADLIRQRQQAQAEAEQLAEARAANALLQDELETKQFNETLADRITRREVGWQQAGEEFETWQSQREAPSVDGLSPAAQERFKGGLMRNRAGGRFTVDRLADAGRQAEFKGVIGETRDTLAKLASDPNADLTKIVSFGAALRDKAIAAGVGDEFDKTQQSWVDRVYYDNATALLNASRGSLDTLAAFENELTAGRYAGKLDAGNQNTLLARVATLRGQLEARAERVVDRKEAEAERALERMDRYVAEGIVPPEEELATLRTQVAGSSREGEWNPRLEGVVQAQQLAQLPPAQQMRFVEEQEAKLAGTATLEQASNIRRTRTVVEARIKELQTDPLGYDAKVQGTTVPPLDLGSMVSGDVSAVRAQIDDRMTAVAAARKRYRTGVGTSPLRPQEAAALSTALAQAEPRQALQVYGTLRQAADDDAYRAIMEQIAPDAPVRAMAGDFYATSPRIAERLLRGEQLLAGKGEAKLVRMPSAKALNDDIARVIGDAFAGRPSDLQAASQAVRAYYAADTADAGDATDEINTERLEAAVAAVIGEPAEIEDMKVIPPRGMDADTFEDKAEVFIEERLKAAGLDDPGNVGMMNVSGKPGLYVLVRKGQALIDRNGVPLVIRMGR